MKRYIVFLKQVPLSTKVEMDPVTRTLKRSSAMARTNPDDLYALQLAVKLKRQTEAEIVAVSMGPASAEEVLREALQRGADKAVLLSSKAFAGSDTWCTSLVLAAAVRKLGEYDLLLFGKMAVDGDTAQVGPEVAGQLDIPQVTHLMEVSDISDTCMCVRKKAGRLLQRMEVDLPCVVTVGRETGELDCPTLTGWRWAQRQSILHWDECDLGFTMRSIFEISSASSRPMIRSASRIADTSGVVTTKARSAPAMAFLNPCSIPAGQSNST